MEPDFSGWATKADLTCSDGRVITRGAFEHQNEVQVPLVWSHMHNDPENILGYAILHAREEGIWTDAYFNDTAKGLTAKALVQHGDISWLSIFANDLVEKVQGKIKSVVHGAIREVSLVIAGANPGAKIAQVALAHGDGTEVELEDAGIITTGIEIEHSATSEEKPEENESGTEENASEEKPEENESGTEENGELQHAADGVTVEEVLNTLNEDQTEALNIVVEAAVEAALAGKIEHSATADDTNTTNAGDGTTEGESLAHQEGSTTMTNAFEASGTKIDGPTLTHAQRKELLTDTIDNIKDHNGSLKESFIAHAATYGIEDIDVLFPDAKALDSQPQLIARRTEWVAKVMDGAKHSPFSRIKSIVADVTAEEARARGYIKGNLKKNEVVKLLKRVTTPTTIYKKQQLDRDDMIDITDFDVVAWLKWEMRFMLEEELARAILIGDGREPDSDDKINEDNLRPIAFDHEMYAHKINLDTNISPDGITEQILRSRKNYRGTGSPTLFTTDDLLTDLILIKDKMGRRLYNTEQELAAALRVRDIVVVEVMEDVPDLLAILVNMVDYTIGADRGGQLTMFDDFDIDFNQYKYLIETRISGALTKPKAALVINRVSGTTVNPDVPGFDSATNTLTIPDKVGVSYFINDVEQVAGPQVITETVDVEARPDAGYNFPHNTDADWTYAYTA